MSATPNFEEKCGIWTVHSETDSRPVLRGFAKSKSEAEELLNKLKGEDADADKTEYWLLELSRGELEDFRQFGMLPPGF